MNKMRKGPGHRKLDVTGNIDLYAARDVTQCGDGFTVSGFRAAGSLVEGYFTATIQDGLGSVEHASLNLQSQATYPSLVYSGIEVIGSSAVPVGPSSGRTVEFRVVKFSDRTAVAPISGDRLGITLRLKGSSI